MILRISLRNRFKKVVMMVNSTAEEIFDPSVKGAALKAAAAGNFDVLPMFDRAMETSSRERIRAIQLEKLIAQVAYTYENVAWYRDKMNEMGVRPEDIKTLEDVRKLPFTDKNALRETFPYGLFAQPLDKIVEMHSSSGTTGKPIVVGYTKHDMAVWSDCIARLASMAGVVPGDRVQMAFGYGMFTGGFGLHYGCMKLGCTMIPAGSGNTERHIQMIEDYGTTGLMNNPNVTETTAASNGADSSSTKWKDKTPQQILKDVNDLLSAVWASCEYDTDAIPNHILLPYEQYNYILTTMVSDLASETIYDFLMKNNAAVKNGGELFIGGCRWCKGAGTGKTDRMVGYVNKPRYIKMDELVPMSRIMTAPNVTNVCYDTAEGGLPCRAHKIRSSSFCI